MNTVGLGLPAQQEGNPPPTHKAFQSSGATLSAAVPLAKANRITKSRVNAGEARSQGRWAKEGLWPSQARRRRAGLASREWLGCRGNPRLIL